MCYNKSVKVIIKSEGVGWKDYKTSDGTLSSDGNEVKLSYSLDGDECMLSIKDNKVIQRRSGEQNVAMTFDEGKRTLCTIGSGGFCGSFEITTEKVLVDINESGLNLSLEYSNGCDNELVKLTLSAE